MFTPKTSEMSRSLIDGERRAKSHERLTLDLFNVASDAWLNKPSGTQHKRNESKGRESEYEVFRLL